MNIGAFHTGSVQGEAHKMFETSKRILAFLLLTSSTIYFSHGKTFDEKPRPTAKVVCETTKGSLTIDVHKEWAPLGAERFVTLVKEGFYTDIALYRCVAKFLTQFGISENESLRHWQRDTILDDPNLKMGIHKNYVSFAGGGPNTRSTQIFIAFEDLDFLGKSPWETPFGEVVEGQATLDALYKEYGDIPPFGKGPDQQKLLNRGNEYIRQNFPKIDFMESCKVVDEEPSMVFVRPKEEGDERDSKRKRKAAKKEIEEENEEDRVEADEEKMDKVEFLKRERYAEEEDAENALEETEEDALDTEVDKDKDDVIPKGPDDLDKLALYEHKSRFRKGAISLKDQLKKSLDSKPDSEAIAKKLHDKKVLSAIYAVILLTVLIGALYYISREKAATLAVGKKS